MSYEDNHQEEEEATQFQNDDLQEPDEEQDSSFLSIWDMVGTYAQSPLETMLSKENAESITLEQVLDEETVIQEVKGANTKVIEFLQRKEHIQKIIEYLITEHYKEDEGATTTSNEEEYNKKVYKFPYIAAEVISCDIDEINEKIIEGDENVMKLFSFLHNKNRGKTPINPFLSQYFTKALSTLVQKYYSRIVTTLISQDSEQFDVLKSLFVENMALPDMDILALKLLGFETSDESAFFGGGEGEFGGLASQQKLKELFMMKQRGNDKQAEENKKKMQQWSMDKGIVTLLIQKIESNLSDDDAARNIFSVLTEIVEKGNSVIHAKILAKETLERILTVILTSPQSNIYMSGLTFLRTVIDASDMYSDGTNVPEALAIIHNRTKDFVEMLTNEKQEQVTITTTHGNLSPPLGEKRLKTVDHLQLLFKSSYKSIHLDLIQQKALDRLLDLFFTYEYNNMLHCAVFSIIRHIIESTSTEELKTALIKDCKLIERMIATYNKNEQVVQEHKGQRLGNMGHIIEICNLLKRVSSQPESTIGQLVREVAGWTDFVNGPLAEINAVNDRQLGGPPPIGGSNQMMSNSMFQFGNEEDDDDDDGVFVDEDDSDSDSDDDEDDVVVKKEGEEQKNEYQQLGNMSTANALGGGDEWNAEFEESEF